jgi:long-chain acyl-CoA synthetase
MSVPRSSNLVELVEHSAGEHPDQIAIRFGRHEISYERFLDAVGRFCRGARDLGLEPGDRAAVMLPNLPQFTISYFGLLKLGATVIPVNTQLKDVEIRYLLEDSEAKALVVWEGYLPYALRAAQGLETCHQVIVLGDQVPEGCQDFTEMLAGSTPDFERAELDATSTAVVFYTAGTTGRPKGAEITHQNLVANTYVLWEIFQMRREDRVLAVLPLFHPFGQYVVQNIPLAAGAAMVLLPEFDAAEVLRVLREQEITVFAGLPPMYHALAEAAQENVSLPKLRLCLSSGGPLHDRTRESFKEKFEHEIAQGYGLSEVSPLVTINWWARTNKAGSVGLPVRGMEVRIVDHAGNRLPPGEVGEILVRGPSVMKGYLNRPAATREVMQDGWFRTGDLGRLDADGYLYLVDRKKDLISKAGFNVYPREVEAFLLGHPKIQDCCVVGVPDGPHGEEVKACIVLKPNQRMTQQEVIDYCRDRMAVYKCPSIVEFYDRLPRSSTGRILKSKLCRGKRADL